MVVRYVDRNVFKIACSHSWRSRQPLQVPQFKPARRQYVLSDFNHFVLGRSLFVPNTKRVSGCSLRQAFNFSKRLGGIGTSLSSESFETNFRSGSQGKLPRFLKCTEATRLSQLMSVHSQYANSSSRKPSFQKHSQVNAAYGDDAAIKRSIWSR